MPTTDDMRKVLDIQDKHISFDDHCVEYGTWKEKTCKSIHGTLTYKPEACEHCGILNKEGMIYKNGTQSSRITLPDYFALTSPPISNSSPPIRKTSPPIFLNRIRTSRQPIRALSPLNSLFCV